MSKVFRPKQYLVLALVAAMLLSVTPVGPTRAQEEDPVAQLMAQMSNAAKVGQLFLVTFPGSEVGEDTVVAELIRDYHISGVVLLPENGNIVNEGDTIASLTTLVDELQEAALVATKPVTRTAVESEEESEEEGEQEKQEEWIPPGPFIPLFVAAAHEGNGFPYTGIVSGTTPLPSEMALGATWNPSYAEAVGQIVGQELRALGINMLLGPSLDVLETPRPSSAGDPGVRVFGGHPFWVGQMGQAYIRGVHTGAEGQIAVVAKHFPGQGTSDRSLEEEISTVQRTLEKLREIDLAPFAAAAQAEDPLARPDGVLVSHIRFRGLEGTRPVSVDSQVLRRLLELPEMASWRAQGGVTISDGLGARALRRFYDPSEESFNSRHIARDAFLAGNDVLLLSQFALDGGWDAQVANIESTITFFQERYDSDPSFQASVDAAVARILRLKLALHGGSFELTPAEPEPAEVETEAEVEAETEAPDPEAQAALQRETLSAISRNAVTLLSPHSPDQVPPPPTFADTIVIFTDGREGLPCATCAPGPYIDPLALRNTILRLYGPDATEQINPSLLASFTFDQLDRYMDIPPPSPTPAPESEGEVTPTPVPPHPIEQALQDADWVIFAMLDPAGDPPQSEVVRRFLAERAAALRDPRLIVLAYDAPYYLDATEISKLSAYYVVYSRVDSFIEASVRALFSEFAPAGAPPVSVSGINYDLYRQTSPDPDQIISLSYGISTLPEEGQPTPEPTEEGQPTPEPPQPQMGDELELNTGVIVDHNGHPVPDGTPIQFIFTYPREGLEHSIIEMTLGGVAETTVVLDRTGQLDISLESDPFPRTLVLQIVIPEDQAAIVLTPTPEPTDTPTPTPTSTPTPEPSPVPPATSTPTVPPPVEEEEEPPPPQENRGVALALALAVILITGGVGYFVVRLNSEPVSVALRLALWCMISGLSLYLAYALRLPGADSLRERSGQWAAVWMTLFGGAMPLIVAWIARRWQRLS